MVTMNPPMQCSRTSSFTAESNSRRNESQGSGMELLGCVGKMFFPQITNKVPVGRNWRTVFTEPGALSVSHCVVAESVLGFKACGFQVSLAFPEFSDLITVACRI